MTHKLRITATVLFGVLTVALVVLWVRSYWRMDQLIYCVSPVNYVACTTMQGQLVFGKSNDPINRQVFKDAWTWRGFAMADWDAALSSPVAYFPVSAPGPHNPELVPLPRFSSQPFLVPTPGITCYEVMLPYWLLVLSTVSIATVLIRRNFSLRNFAIATALFSVILGVAAIDSG